MEEVKNYLLEILETFIDTLKFYFKIGIPFWGIISAFVTFYFTNNTIENFSDFLPIWAQIFAFLFLSVPLTLMLLVTFFLVAFALIFFLLSFAGKVISSFKEKWD